MNDQNYGIVRIEKAKSGDVLKLQKHINREKESYQNPDIDRSRSYLNYSLIHCTDFKKEVSHEIEELHLKRMVRKDANVMISGIMTASPEFFQNECNELMHQQEFFKSGIRALEKMGWHIFSAEVHMDETTPHMHFCSVPITEDGRLSAKKIVGNKANLSRFQDRMYEECFKQYGLSRGVKNSGTTYKSLHAFKHDTEKEITVLREKREQLCVEIAEKQNQLQELQTRLEEAQERLIEAENYYKQLQRDAQTIREQLQQNTQAILDGPCESPKKE